MKGLESIHKEIDSKKADDKHPLEVQDGEQQFVIVNRALSPESWEAVKDLIRDMIHHK